MTAVDAILTHLGAVLLSGGGVAAGYAAVRHGGEALRTAFDRLALRLDGELGFLRSSLRGRLVLGLQVGTAMAGVGLAWSTGTWPLLALSVTAVAAPGLWIERRRASRVLALEGQLADWLVAVSAALQAGNAIGEALASSAKVTGPPMRDEVEETLGEFALGAPLDDALARMVGRVRSRSLGSAVFILSLGRLAGGDLPLTLERAAGSLREMARLEGVVRAKTAEGKAQALVISVIPAPLVGGIEWLDPGYFAPLTASATGWGVCAGALAMWLTAIVLASRIVAMEI